MMFSADFAVTLPQVKGGKIRGLAVISSKRSPAVPDLPSVNEALAQRTRLETAKWAKAIRDAKIEPQ